MIEKTSLTSNQDTAANPLENVWVQANAGTGKTKVLIQRLLRILFRSNDITKTGILCLTYTNIAVAEMRNRILAGLSSWAKASDEDLAILLDGIVQQMPVTKDDIKKARSIFYTYIDNPDILKIKTIHGFCEEILRRFPLEAGISPSWSLIQDANQKVLLQEAFTILLGENKTDLDINIKDAFLQLVEIIPENYMDTLLDILSKMYKHFFQIKDFVKYRKYFIDTTRKFLNLDDPTQTEVSPEKLRKIKEEALKIKKPAKYLIKIIENTDLYIENTIDFEDYKEPYLKSSGEIQNHITKNDFLIEEANRIYLLNQRIQNQKVFDRTMAIFDLSAGFAKIYKGLKLKHNVLDFEDLVLYVKKLFSSPENMGWVLSQLNVSLNYILVDEAQDTSPVQWEVLRMLSQDFFTEGDTENSKHSLFVVGDTKQSIYGFQGADPKSFAVSRSTIGQQIEQNNRVIQDVPLSQSFRSLPAILNTVDAFFSSSDVIEKTGFVNNTHATFRKDKKGLVEIHKLVSKAEDDVDTKGYIRNIADKIKSLIDSKEYLPKDIMVLVQNRHPFSALLVSELKRLGIEVAGSDRIVLPNFSAIRDLLYLIRFCINSADDYSLCCVLKSPIFRLKEDDIFKLCFAKNQENKKRHSESAANIPISVFDIINKSNNDIYNLLNDFISWSKLYGPYSFFMKVLQTNSIRQSFISALGDQVIDPLEEFLTISLAYERTQPGTLKHFLKWFVTGGSEIKRDMYSSSGVRIVTVHGSKGLEAPVVFLIDTVSIPSKEPILPVDSNLLVKAGCKIDNAFPDVWLWAKDIDDSIQTNLAAEEKNRLKIEEYYRLLYVAMTRAKDRLYIYGYTSRKNANALSWHSMLWNVLSENEKAIKEDDLTIRFTND